MAKFLNTTGINYHLEQLINNCRERLILISPYLKLNDRIKELLADKDRLKIDVRIVYGKHELHPEEIGWLRELTYVRTSFCRNLHAKCYLSEEQCLITSLNLYAFSQVNNNEMGILIDRAQDAELYSDAHQEAQRIIRVSDEVRISLEKVEKQEEPDPAEEPSQDELLPTSKIARKLGLKTAELTDQLIAKGFPEDLEGQLTLTPAGQAAGGVFKNSPRFGQYFLCPKDFRG